MSNVPPSEEEILWRQYALYADLYKTYITAAIQLSVFVYAITGGMISYFFVHASVPQLRWALVLPTVFNAGITFLYFRGLPLLAEQLRQAVEIAGRLRLPGYPSYHVLSVLLWLFGLLHALTVVGLVVLLIYGWTPQQG